MENSELGVVRLPHAEGLDLPSYATACAAGMDLRAACAQDAPVPLPPGARALIPTGMIFEIPEGYEGQIRPRSGLAYKNGVTCLNAPGTIDADYRGEAMILLINHGEKIFTVERGMRIAQIVIAPVKQVALVEMQSSTKTARGHNGFGSTGI